MSISSTERVFKAIHNFHIRLPEACSEGGLKAAIEWETSSRADSSSQRPYVLNKSSGTRADLLKAERSLSDPLFGVDYIRITESADL